MTTGKPPPGHENRLMAIRDAAEQEMTTLRQTNLRRLQELNAEIQRFEIEMKEMEELSRSKAHVHETNARSAAEVEVFTAACVLGNAMKASEENVQNVIDQRCQITRAQGNEEAAKINSQKEAEARVRRTEIEAEAAKTRAEKEAEVAILKSKAQLMAAAKKAEGMMAEATAAAKAAKCLAEKRKFQLEWKRVEVITLAAKGRKLVSGEAGARLMDELIPSAGMSTAGD